MSTENLSQTSPFSDSISEQVTQIREILSNLQTFGQYSNSLSSNIIPSLNKQLKSYSRNSIKAVLNDIPELLLNESIAWTELQTRLTNDLSGKKTSYKIEPTFTFTLQSPPSVSLSYFDDDPITNMQLTLSSSTAKEFSKYRKLALAELSNITSSIDELEKLLVNYRTSAIESIKGTLLEYLYQTHYNYVSEMFRQKKELQKSVKINGIEFPLCKSQSKFFTTVIKSFKMMFPSLYGK